MVVRISIASFGCLSFTQIPASQSFPTYIWFYIFLSLTFVIDTSFSFCISPPLVLSLSLHIYIYVSFLADFFLYLRFLSPKLKHYIGRFLKLPKQFQGNFYKDKGFKSKAILTVLWNKIRILVL